MFWPKAACLILPAMTFSCSSGGNFQCNINSNGTLFSTKAMKTDMSIRYPTATRTPCRVDLRKLAGTADVRDGDKPIVVTKTDVKVQPAHGKVEQQGHYVSYTPQNDYVGPDKFTLVLSGHAGDVAGVSALDVSVDVKR